MRYGSVSVDGDTPVRWSNSTPRNMGPGEVRDVGTFRGSRVRTGTLPSAAVIEATALLTKASEALISVSAALLTTMPKPKQRAELRRQLSGVLASVETVRLALDK